MVPLELLEMSNELGVTPESYQPQHPKTKNKINLI